MATQFNLTQRRYVLNELIKRKSKQLEKKYAGKGSALLRGRESYLVEPRLYREYEPGSRTKVTYVLKYIKGYMLDSKTCVNLDATAKDFGDGQQLPDTWYFEQYKAGHYVLKAEMEKCMVRPKLTCTFPNEAKELKKHQASARKKFKAAYKAQADVLSELRYDVMQFNNWLEDEAKPAIMLSKGDADLLTKLLKTAVNL